VHTSYVFIKFDYTEEKRYGNFIRRPLLMSIFGADNWIFCGLRHSSGESTQAFEVKEEGAIYVLRIPPSHDYFLNV